MPVTNVFSLDRRWPAQRVNGHGVGALLYAEQAIRHEAIKDDICQTAQLFWVGNSAPVDPVSCQAVDIIMSNIRFVSVANAWYRVVLPVSGVGFPDELALHQQAPSRFSAGHASPMSAIFPVMPSAHSLAEASILPGRAGLLVTLFGEESGIFDSGECASTEMAIVVERYAGANEKERLQSGGYSG